MIETKVEHAGATAALEKVAQAVTNRAPLMKNIAGIMADAVEENFAQQGRPKWAGLKNPGPRRSGGKILQDSGRLASSITPSSDNDSAVVGTNIKYAAIHQFGGQTRAHLIKPKNKKALAFGGKVVKQVNHPGSKIPARPFLQLTDSDCNEIEQTAEDYLRQVTG